MYFFNPETKSFLPASLRDLYIESGTWPEKTIELTEDELLQFTQLPPEGKMLGVAEGRPVWVDVPAPTRDELVNIADADRQCRIESALNSVSLHRLKLQMGRDLSDEEKKQLGDVVDYIDSLKLTDISTAPDVNWPVIPA